MLFHDFFHVASSFEKHNTQISRHCLRGSRQTCGNDRAVLVDFMVKAPYLPTYWASNNQSLSLYLNSTFAFLLSFWPHILFFQVLVSQLQRLYLVVLAGHRNCTHHHIRKSRHLSREVYMDEATEEVPEPSTPRTEDLYLLRHPVIAMFRQNFPNHPSSTREVPHVQLLNRNDNPSSLEEHTFSGSQYPTEASLAIAVSEHSRARYASTTGPCQQY